MKYLVTILIFCSCMTPQKAVSYLKGKQLLADTCAANYPVKDSVSIKDSISFDTLYLENEIYLRDTVLLNGQPVYVEKKCPPNTVITKVQVKEIFTRDRAYEQGLQNSIDAKQKDITQIMQGWDKSMVINEGLVKDNDSLKKERNKWRRWFFLLLTANIAFIAFKIFKPSISLK